MTATTSAEILRQYKSRFSLIVVQILTVASSPSMVRALSYETERQSRKIDRIVNIFA